MNGLNNLDKNDREYSLNQLHEYGKPFYIANTTAELQNDSAYHLGWRK